MQKVFLFIVFVIYSMTLAAVPAKRERCILTLADGSTIEATWMGNESVHFYKTDDGKFLQCDSNGIAYYIEQDVLQKRWKAKASKRQAVITKWNATKRKRAQGAMTGSKRGLVILVQFPQTPFYYTNAEFWSFFNEEGYSDEINMGSVHDYFHDASYGQFDFSFDVVGPVELDNPLSHYGGNNSNGDDKFVATMAAEAIMKVDKDVDFSQYDWDKDGEVEQIFIIHSGYDEAQSRRNDDIWSHAWTLTEAMDEGDGKGPVETDDVIIDSYACSSELRGRTGINIVGIGTACHEFSHCFGLPDFYDTQGSNFGMDTWSLMDYGSYNGEGGTPAGFTSYERWFCGWLEPTELIHPIAITDMPALTSKPVAYLLKNSGKSDEYFLLENRQQEGWDCELSGHGMLVLHVDYDETAWIENTVNNVRNHQRMTIIPANNFLFSYNKAGQPYPGTSGNNELSDASTPAWALFYPNAEGDKLMNHSITEITESPDGLISFIFDEEALDLKDLKDLKDFKAPIYNLAGQRLSKPQKGINIINGKKHLE